MNVRHLYVATAMMAAMASPLAVGGSASERVVEAGAVHGNWVTTWHASPQPVWQNGFILPTGIPELIEQQTVREIARISGGGRRLRIVLSNRYGKSPLMVGEVHAAAAGAGSSVIEGTSKRLSFGGLQAVTIPPGATVVSDPLDMEVRPLSRLAVSVYLPRPTVPQTFHWGEQQTGFIAPGNATSAPRLDPQLVFKGRLLLSSVLVEAAPEARTVVAFGDSITDGNGSTPDRDRRWPDFLAQRLANAGVAVANAGISGARLLADGMGENALARFGQDVLEQPGIRTVVVLLGINDIGWPGGPFAPQEAPRTAEDLIAGYRQLIAQARLRKVRIVGATLLPFEGALQGTPLEGHYSADKERLRQAINQWIRSSGEFDAVADFDALMRDPDRPSRMRAAFDSGDHLHPGDAGYQAMAEMLDMAMLFGGEGDGQGDQGRQSGTGAGRRR